MENGNNLVKCQNCGTENGNTSKFCIRCGSPLVTGSVNEQVVTENINPQPSVSINPQPVNENVNAGVIQPQPSVVNEMPQVQPNIVSEMPQAQPVNQVTGTINYFKYVVNILTKPFSTYKEADFSNIKNVSILTGLVVIVLTLINLITSMISAVRVTSFWSDEVTWVWENLKNIQYFKVIGQNILIYLGIIIGISAVYFLGSLIIKKESNFIKLVSATATAFIPYVIVAILSPLVSLISSTLGLCVTVIGIVYSLAILFELLNDQIVIENKNTKILFHAICMSIVLIVGGYIAYKMIVGALTSGLGSLLGGF